MKTIFVILFVLCVVALCLVVGIHLLSDAFKGLGEEPEPSGRTEERKNTKIREELARRRAGEETISAQERMADLKLTKEIERWREES